MASRHHDVEYIPLDPGPGEPSTAPRSSFASAKYAGHLFLAAVLFAGILVGAGIGRWTTVPNVVTTIVPPVVVSDPVHYDPVVTIFDSFVDMYASTLFRRPIS